MTKNLSSLGNILRKSLADPNTNNENIPEINNELNVIG